VASHPRSDDPSSRLSRRRFLGAGLALAASGIAACGDRTQPSASTPSPSPSAVAAVPSPSSTASASPQPLPSPSASWQPSPSLRSTIASLLIVGFRGLTLAAAATVASAIEKDGLGGVILFDRDQLTGGSRNVASATQLRTLTQGLAERAGDRRLIVAIDQEGGRVTRLGPSAGFPAVASEAAIGAADDDARTAAWADGIATTLAGVGVNLNLAPVVDLNVNPENPAIGALGRSFSADPVVVSNLALIEVGAHHDRGVATCLKHFPGLGSATANTDFGVADVTKTWTRRELEPFRSIVGSGIADAVMAGHLVNRNLDADRPASLSKTIVGGLLRNELGWNGVVVTDDLQAAAITTAFGADEAIALALEAGNDLLLFANQQRYDPDIATHAIATIERLVRSGRISEDRLVASAARVAHLWDRASP
jgi:beta-N-acetylhexosaminidase